jgi:chromatin structure-remodeling complex subunit RSC9
MTKEAREEKKRLLSAERFGLPIPDSILKEEEEEEKDVKRDEEDEMSEEERKRAVEGFGSVEERIMEVVEGNVSTIGHYLGEAFGW